MSARCIWRTAALGLLCVTLAACGNLRVTVGVLDPKVARSQLDQDLVDKLLPTIQGSTPQTIEGEVEKLRVAHRDAYRKLRVRYEADAAKLPEPTRTGLLSLARGLTDGFESRTRDLYRDLRLDLQQYRADVTQRMGTRFTLGPGDADYAGVVAVLRVWQQRVTQTAAIIRAELDQATVDAAETFRKNAGLAANAPEAESLKREVLVGVDSQLAQLSIQNSPFAHAVANAPDMAWTERYNQVVAQSWGGASDVAIRLDPKTGNYMLKGLSFDPSDVAAMASKVTTQAMLVAAQMAGVPVKSITTPPTNTPGAALAASSSALADAQASLVTRQAKVKARQQALQEIAQAILSEEADLKSTDATTRQAAVAAIRSALDKRLAIIRSTATP